MPTYHQRGIAKDKNCGKIVVRCHMQQLLPIAYRFVINKKNRNCILIDVHILRLAHGVSYSENITKSYKNSHLWPLLQIAVKLGFS